MQGSNTSTHPAGTGAGAATTGTATTGAADPTARTAPAADLQEKAKSAWDYGLASLQVSDVKTDDSQSPGSHFAATDTTQSAVNQVGAAIDAKTATPEKPGLFTQVSSAVQQGVASIEKAVTTVSREEDDG